MKTMKGSPWRAVALTLALAACQSGEAEEAPSIATTPVERGDLRITAEATGTVEPIRRVEVKSKASGEILDLHVDIGDDVRRGTLLAEIEPRDVRNAYDQAVADLDVAVTRRDITQSQLERSQELHESGVITDQELENARLEYANAEATLIRARANKELAELRMEDVTIQAPLAGTILEKNVEEGVVIQSASQNVSGGTTLYVMASLEEMQVRTMVDETDMGQIRPDMTADVTVEAYPDRLFQGTVEKIEPQAVVQQNVTMFPVIVRLDNRAGLLRPGMNAEVEILVDEATDVLLVPNNAIVNMEDVGPAAMVLGLSLDELELGRFRQAGPGSGAAEGTGEASGPMRPGLDSLRARVEAGEISQDSMRALLESMRSRAGAGGDMREGAVPGVGMGAPGTPRQRTRRAVLFVMNDAGEPVPTVVEIGLNDWDRTQVVSGVEEGDQIALIGAAQLQAQQDEFMNRVRSRRGGPF